MAPIVSTICYNQPYGNAKASKVFTSLAQANPQLASAWLKYAKKPQGNGVLHSIHDPGSPVKAQAAKISSQTETLQFKEFFGDVKKDPGYHYML